MKTNGFELTSEFPSRVTRTPAQVRLLEALRRQWVFAREEAVGRGFGLEQCDEAIKQIDQTLEELKKEYPCCGVVSFAEHKARKQRSAAAAATPCDSTVNP